MHESGLTVSTPTDTTVVLTRRFKGPRRMVWSAMTTPEKMRRWMLPPPGWTMSTCECDVAVAGVLRLAWKEDGGGQTLTLLGVFTDVRVQERMVHTEVMVLGSGEIIGSQVETHEFGERDGVTTLRITQRYASREVRDCAIESGACSGLEAGFQKLDAELAGGAW